MTRARYQDLSRVETACPTFRSDFPASLLPLYTAFGRPAGARAILIPLAGHDPRPLSRSFEGGNGVSDFPIGLPRQPIAAVHRVRPSRRPPGDLDTARRS